MRKLSGSESFFLDAVRYAAATAVVLFHLSCYFFSAAGVGDRTLPYYDQLGFAGLSVFFVLSGFVIACSVFRKLAERDDYSLKTYLVERFARVFVVLVPAVAVVALVDVLVLKPRFPELDLQLWPYLLTTPLALTDFKGFGSGAVPLPTIYGLDPVWSLSYEVCLYLAFGLAVMLVRRPRRRAAAAAALAGTLLFYGRFNHVGLLSYNWLLGVAAFALFQRGVLARSRAAGLGFLGVAAAAAAGLLLLTGRQPLELRQWVYVSLAAVVFSALFAVAGTFAVGPRAAAAARFLASCSFSLYLLHFVLVDVACNCFVDVKQVLAKGPLAVAAFFAVVFAAVNVLSWIFSLATERNTPRLRRALLGALRSGA